MSISDAAIYDVTRALVVALIEDGAAGAPWGNRVYLRRTSDVVQVSGTPGAPQAIAWPCLFLFGPDVAEEKEHRRPHTTYETAYNATAHTVEQRRWPVFYRMSFRVVWQTRSGFGTGATGTGVTAEEQSLRGVSRLSRWVDGGRAIDGGSAAGGGTLFLPEPLGTTRGARTTPADIIEAQGELLLRWVPEARGTMVTRPTDLSLGITAEVVDTIPA